MLESYYSKYDQLMFKTCAVLLWDIQSLSFHHILNSTRVINNHIVGIPNYISIFRVLGQKDLKIIKESSDMYYITVITQHTIESNRILYHSHLDQVAKLGGCDG